MKPGANASSPVNANLLSKLIPANPMMYQSIIRAVNQRIVMLIPVPLLKVLAPCIVARLPPVLVINWVLMDTPVEIIAGNTMSTSAADIENICNPSDKPN